MLLRIAFFSYESIRRLRKQKSARSRLGLGFSPLESNKPFHVLLFTFYVLCFRLSAKSRCSIGGIQWQFDLSSQIM